MAKVYGPPKEIHQPQFEDAKVNGHYDNELSRKLDDEYIGKVRAWAKANSTDRDAGEIIGFPVADGQAQYMVFTGGQLIHLPLGDGYSIPDAHARGLRIADVRRMVRGEQALAKLFTEKAGGKS